LGRVCQFLTDAMGFAARLGKYPDRDEKLAISAPAFPAKAGTHGSAGPNFSNDCNSPTATRSCGGTMDPGFRRGRRVDRLPKGFLLSLSRYYRQNLVEIGDQLAGIFEADHTIANTARIA